MDNAFINDLNDLARKFHDENLNNLYSKDILGFKKWISDENIINEQINSEPDWKGKEYGRTSESVISTLLVHLNRYAQRYGAAAIAGSDFVAQDDFIYLINLKAFGKLTKDDLIKKNVHNHTDGLAVISRLETNGWIESADELSNTSNLIQISEKGNTALENQMNKIRKATSMVAGDLNHQERIELIKILTKLELHHQSFFKKCDISDLIKMMH